MPTTMPLPPTSPVVEPATLTERQQLKLAAFILQRITQPPHTSTDRISASMREATFQAGLLEVAQKRLAICTNRGWTSAARHQAQTVYRLCTDLISTTNVVQTCALSACQEPPLVLTTAREILSDLQQLSSEFASVTINCRERTITVTTDPITLNDQYLGPFEIVLRLADLANSRGRTAYKIVATDPHPASSNDAVTHPHVRDEELCEGDATHPIRRALESGRLLDFFVLVRSVLQNYNAGSPYVALDDWEGISCHDCGYTASDDDRSYCEGCSHDFCNDCTSYCRCCDSTRCQGCLDTCKACDQSTCHRCMKECSECGEDVCKSCLENNLCPDCREKAEEPDDSDNSSSGVTPNAQPAQAESAQSEHAHVQAA